MKTPSESESESEEMEMGCHEPFDMDLMNKYKVSTNKNGTNMFA